MSKYFEMFEIRIKKPPRLFQQAFFNKCLDVSLFSLCVCVLNKQDLEKPGATLVAPALWIMLDGSWDLIFCRYWPGKESHLVLMIKEIIPHFEL